MGRPAQVDPNATLLAAMTHMVEHLVEINRTLAAMVVARNGGEFASIQRSTSEITPRRAAKGFTQETTIEELRRTFADMDLDPSVIPELPEGF